MDQTIQKSTQPKPALIIDTNAFIRCLDIHKLAEKYEIYTSHSVLNEIKDKAARDKFAALNLDIGVRSGDDKSFKFVDDFSKRTGDYFSLSFTDKELIAIAVSLVHQRGKAELLRKQPPELTEWIPPANHEGEEEEENENEHKAVDDDGFVTITKGKQLTQDDIKKDKKHVEIGDNKEEKAQGQDENTKEDNQEEDQEKEGEGEGEGEEEEEGEETLEGQVDVKEDNQKLEGIVLERITENQAEGDKDGKKDEKKEGDDDDSDFDDGKGWINRDNIAKVLYKGNKKEDKIQEVGVVVMTTDYSMQNVIIQVGIPLLSTEGFIIRQTRRFILECYCCHKICKDSTKQFCPACGNPTLTKLSVRANDDGTMTFFRNPKKKISTRGKIYSIPKSQGGRSNNDLLLREDEFLMKGRLQQLERQEKEKDKKFKQRLQDYENGLTFDDIRLQHKYNQSKIQIGYGKINPNDRFQFKKKR